jgi:hypothetical protein
MQQQRLMVLISIAVSILVMVYSCRPLQLGTGTGLPPPEVDRPISGSDDGDGDAPIPHPSPPVVCGLPSPIGIPAEFVLNKFGTKWDSTFRLLDRAYCEAANFGARHRCPVRNEGSIEREVCEEEVIGTQQWWCDGIRIASLENPAQAKCKGVVRTCTENGKTCSTKTW